VAFRVIRPDELEWTTRRHEPEEAPRHVAELTELAGFVHTRANVWRYPARIRPAGGRADGVGRNTFRSLT
jgi:hypothetical protein